MPTCVSCWCFWFSVLGRFVWHLKTLRSDKQVFLEVMPSALLTGFQVRFRVSLTPFVASWKRLDMGVCPGATPELELSLPSPNDGQTHPESPAACSTSSSFWGAKETTPEKCSEFHRCHRPRLEIQGTLIAKVTQQTWTPGTASFPASPCGLHTRPSSSTAMSSSLLSSSSSSSSYRTELSVKEHQSHRVSHGGSPA